MPDGLHRQAEPELMDEADEALAYAVADFAEVNVAFVERLCELAKGRERAVALDLGTGPADIPVRLAKVKPGWRIYAADASWAMLTHARALLETSGAGVGLLMADAKRLPVGKRSVDVIFSNSILHHINETVLFWSEIKRIAKPGTLIFLRDLARPRSAADALDIVRSDSIQASKIGRKPPIVGIDLRETEQEGMIGDALTGVSKERACLLPRT